MAKVIGYGVGYGFGFVVGFSLGVVTVLHAAKFLVAVQPEKKEEATEQ